MSKGVTLRVNSISAGWRFRTWQGPIQGVVSALGGIAVWMALVAGIEQIDGAGNAKSPNAAQDVVISVAVVVFLGVPVVWAWLFAGRCRRTVIAETPEGLAIVARRTVQVPWSMIAGVALVAPRRGSRRRAPAVVLKNGLRLPMRRASSRFSQEELAVIESHPDTPPLENLSEGAAVRLLRELTARMPAGIQAVPVGAGPSRPLRSEMVEDLPGPPTFQRRSREVAPAHLRGAGYGAVLLGVGRIAVSLATSQEKAGHPFDWGAFLLALLGVLAGIEALLLVVLWFAPAALAVGDGWVARRRYFHRRWLLLDLEQIISARAGTARRGTRRRGAGLGPSLILSGPDGRRITISPMMLRSGAAAPLAAQLTRSSVAFPGVIELLTSAPAATPIPAPNAQARARMALWQALGVMVSYLIVGGLASSLAIAHGAPWVLAPAVLALAAIGWAAFRRYRDLRLVRSQGPGIGVGPVLNDRLSTAILRVGQIAYVSTIAVAAWAIHAALVGPPPAYSTATLTHVTSPLPASLSATVRQPDGTIDPSYANDVIRTLWTERQQALSRLDPNQLQLVDAPSSEALAADIALITLATFGQAPGNKIPAQPDLAQRLIVGSQTSYPLSVLGEVDTTPDGPARQTITLVIAEQLTASSPWNVVFTTDYTTNPGVNPFLPAATPHTASTGADPTGIADQLAAYWQGWMDHHRAPPSRFDPGPWTTTLGAQIAKTTQGQVVNGGLNTVTIHYRPGYGPWAFPGPFGGPLTCTGILVTNIAKSTGSTPMRQDRYRWNWGALLPPGYYHQITDVSVHPSCIAAEPNGHMLVIGGDRQELTTTGTP